MTPVPAPVLAALAPVLATVLLTGCSGGDGGAAAEPVATPTPSPSATPSPTPSPTASPTPQAEFAREVEELYALVQRSVEGSADHASSSTVLGAFATTVALVRVEPEQVPDRQRVVDAAEGAADAYRTAAEITHGVERAAAVQHAIAQLRVLEAVIRALPR